MKTQFLKSKTGYAIIFLTGLAVAISCKKSNTGNEIQPDQTQLSKDEEMAIAKAGFSPADAFKKDGGYLVEGDIFLDAKNLAIQQGIVDDLNKNKPSTEQYRTTNIVSVGTSRTLKIKVDAGASQTVFTDATTEALKRYNDLNLKLSFRLLDATSTETADISIIGADLGKASNGQTILGQSAGFPANGNPATPIKLNNKVYSATYDKKSLLATVIAHEIGHAIGFRHTDYADRNYSCDIQTYNSWLGKYLKQNEGKADVGAVHIPGTPTAENGDPESWMLACLGNNSRPFTTYDQVAIKALYPVK
ncbi:M57 family metalloprotease [Pedobacter miscanthi]|uniref:Protease n=1 Tax=Pedobacter miscanthi TaxID=2259170 RepID=A0A366LDB5_9SPHI|nr:M57 family metalloprotease [Pedobacter miscanthi]RBQ11885.1 protease [Pedobacter miscanthi]